MPCIARMSLDRGNRVFSIPPLLSGLAYWGLLSIEDRKFILAVIDKSMKHAERSHSLRVLNVIKRYDFLELYCFIESEIKFVQNFCEKNLK